MLRITLRDNNCSIRIKNQTKAEYVLTIAKKISGSGLKISAEGNTTGRDDIGN